MTPAVAKQEQVLAEDEDFLISFRMSLTASSFRGTKPPSPKSNQGKTSVEETNEKDDSRQQKGVGMMIDPMSPYYLHASDALGQQWMRCNAMVKGWLKSAMDKDICGSVRFAITARDIWRDLEERFGKESAPRAFEIRWAVTLLRQDKATVSTYYTKLKSLWDEMNCTTPLPMCNCQEFNTVKSQILGTRPIPTLGVSYHMVSEDEQQRLVSSTAKHGTEMTAFHVQSRRVEKSRGEPIDNKNKRKDRPTCGHCESSANPIVNMAGKLEHHETWVIDSGATYHIVNNPTLLSKIEDGCDSVTQ
nr:Integrase, catalytic core [Ipomoea batatas]